MSPFQEGVRSHLWPIHPQPQEDELLSTWMIRIAHSNGCKVHSFYAGQYGADRQIWTRDIDHFAPRWLIEELSYKTGCTIDRIEQTTLRQLESIVFENFNEAGVTKFVMSLRTIHRTRVGYGDLPPKISTIKM